MRGRLLRASRTRLLVLAMALASGDARGAPEATEPSDWGDVGREAAGLLSGYIRIDTSNPPGNELEGAAYLKRFFDAEGIPAELYVSEPARGSVIARLAATHPSRDGHGPILLLSHIDVVPADPASWSFPPFSGAIEDGIVHGRGAIDDKGHGIVHALALALLERLRVPRRRDVVFCATAAEEAGTNLGADRLVEKHWESLGPPSVVWNEGGVTTRHPLLGEGLVNAVATSEKLTLWMTLRAEGESGHGSMPHGDAAPSRLAAALARIAAEPRPLRLTPPVAEMMRRLAEEVEFPLSFAMRHLGNPLMLRIARRRLEANRVTNAMMRDTIALTGLRSGLKHNVIPAGAEATLDVRLLPDTEPREFLDWLEAVIDDPKVRIEVEPDADGVAFRRWLGRVVGDAEAQVPPSSLDHELFRALEAELRRELPGTVSVPVQTTGGTDSKYFRARGVPAFGYLPATLTEAYVSTLHGVDERIPINELERAVRVTYRTLSKLLR